jgi:hypothetical protein
MIATGILTGMVLMLLWLAVGSDREEKRLCALYVDGKATPAASIVVARRWLNVRTGLLNHAGLAPDAGLLLRGARSVDTRGMLFAVDVMFLDRMGRVLMAATAP